MKRKAQGLSLNTIIIAAIVLIVLIVLIAVFTGKINIFGDSYADADDKAKQKVCLTQGGRCGTEETCNSEIKKDDFVDCAEGQICCIPI
jgi:uncharacterized membrane protein